MENVVKSISFRFNSSDLVAFRDLLAAKVGALEASRQLPFHNIAHADVVPLPIHEVLFHVEAGIQGAAGAGGAGAEKIWCKLCLIRGPRSGVRVHVGGHILEGEVR